MLKKFSLLAFAAAVLATAPFAHPAQAGVGPPTVTVEEFFTAPNGRYRVTIDNGSCCAAGSRWELFAFAVENNGVSSTSTTRPGWTSMIADQSSWDAGIDLGLANTSGSAFTNFFDASDTVALYWNLSGSNIGPGPDLGFGNPGDGIASDDRFFFDTLFVLSNFVAFGNSEGGTNGGPLASGDATDGGPFFATPEPGSLAVVALGLLGLGFARRRRGG